MVHSMDRLARNSEDLLRTVRELTNRGVTVEFLKNHLVFSGQADPMAKLMMTMLAAVAEFERDLLRERQREGIAIAKAKGVYKGRKKALTSEQAVELIQCARSGMPKAELARSYGISRETLYQYLRAGERRTSAG
jgi:DNA invertase Pin-like site-specific DNA recombinase